MGVAIPLDKMTTAEKLQALEDIWEDLLKTPEDIPVPAWHLELLREREALVKSGTTEFIELSEAMGQIREEIQ